jgi:hypothetical protein
LQAAPETTELTERQARARLAAQSRWHPGSEAVEDARKARQAVDVEERVRRLVDAAPPLSPEQRNRLALLLLSGGAA